MRRALGTSQPLHSVSHRDSARFILHVHTVHSEPSGLQDELHYPKSRLRGQNSAQRGALLHPDKPHAQALSGMGMRTSVDVHFIKQP